MAPPSWTLRSRAAAAGSGRDADGHGGGDEDAYPRAEVLLREFGSPTRVEGNGEGLALKLAINISLAVQMVAFSEGLLLAQESGIDAMRALHEMTGSPITADRADDILKTARAWLGVLPVAEHEQVPRRRLAAGGWWPSTKPRVELGTPAPPVTPAQHDHPRPRSLR